MIHDFDPKTMKLPYVQEINYYQEEAHRLGEPLIIKEWDNEYAPAVAERLQKYIEQDPERPHVAPYLTNIHFGLDGTPLLFWAHRVQGEQVQRFTMEEIFHKLVPVKSLPLTDAEKKLVDLNRTVTMTLRYPAWVAGGEREADIISLGFTYLPYSFWSSIYPDIKNLPWNILDVEISARLIHAGLKAQLHWDCTVNHSHIDIREREKSVFRKWIGIDKTPLTQEEKVWLKVDKLPSYHAFIGEPVKLFSDQVAIACPRCSLTNTWEEVAKNDRKCRSCGADINHPYPPGFAR